MCVRLVMCEFTDGPRGWWLAREMALRIGVSLPRAVLAGWLSRAELNVMVVRCARCPQPARCHDWIAKADAAASGAGQPATGAPAFCANKHEIDALSAGRAVARG